ncbi:unnamed protein product [Blepharisma stoltei]|uniref:Uncharacterized protein n=1 Tax=Blepharisma stoltei TaxID=1481888 RepID=A0AAU9K4C3_9CILI|nr:unnamed protein product [Blepharisma stoltei]
MEKSIKRAKKFQLEKVNSKNAFTYKVKENKSKLEIYEEQKTIEKINTLNQSLEASKKKREDYLKGIAEKLSDVSQRRKKKVMEELRKEEERQTLRNREFDVKELNREKIREQTKEWYTQQAQLLSEWNSLRRSDHYENFTKNQYNLNTTMKKILNKQQEKDNFIKRIKDTEKKLSQVKKNIDETLNINKEIIGIDVNNAIIALHKKKYKEFSKTTDQTAII